MDKKGQFTLAFNWIYVLVAGAVILLFFVGLVVQQKTSAEERLTSEITQILDSILTAASVSEKTKNTIPASALNEFTLEFTCELTEGGGFKDIFSGYGVKGTSSTVETATQVIFAPKEINSAELITWSLPYNLPFKVRDILLLTSRNTKYYVLGGEGIQIREELFKNTEEFNFEFVSSLSGLSVGDNHHVRIVEFAQNNDNPLIRDGYVLPSELSELSNSQVSAVLFTSLGGIHYFEKSGNVLRKTTRQEIKPVTLGLDQRDAATLAVIFAGDWESYQCNMMKVFERLEIVAETHSKKYEALRTYYDPAGPSRVDIDHKKTCHDILKQANPAETLASSAYACTIAGDCGGLVQEAVKVKRINDELRSSGCIWLY